MVRMKNFKVISDTWNKHSWWMTCIRMLFSAVHCLLYRLTDFSCTAQNFHDTGLNYYHIIIHTIIGLEMSCSPKYRDIRLPMVKWEAPRDLRYGANTGIIKLHANESWKHVSNHKKSSHWFKPSLITKFITHPNCTNYCVICKKEIKLLMWTDYYEFFAQSI